MSACALLSLLVACAGGPGDEEPGIFVTQAGLYQLEVEMSPDPPVADLTTLTVTLTTAETGAPETGAALAVTPWMPEHGHGIQDEPEVTEVDGVYTVEFVYTMPGTWELTFEVDGSLGADSGTMTVQVQ